MDPNAIFENIVRVGIVTDTDYDKRRARVKFPDINIPSDWLPVLASRPYVPDYDVPQRTEPRAGGSGYPQFEEHDHDLKIKPWMPKVNAVVLCLYIPIFNADGFILGELGPLGDLKQWTDQ